MTLVMETARAFRPGPASSGFSNEARAVLELASIVTKSLEQSEALFGPKAAALSQIRTLVDECAEVGWDGDAAEPVPSIAEKRTIDLIRALPDLVPLPEFAPEPDGSISLDWIRSRNRLFSLSIGTSDRLAYAWLDGTDRGHAVARFDGEMVPPRILEGIRRIMDRGDTPVRTR